MLGKLGLRLKSLRKEGARGERQLVYRFQTPADGHDEVFAGWLARENVSKSDTVVTLGNKEYLDNSLDYQTPQSMNQKEAAQFTEENIANAVSMLEICDEQETTLAVFSCLRGFCQKVKEAIWARIPSEKRR